MCLNTSGMESETVFTVDRSVRALWWDGGLVPVGRKNKRAEKFVWRKGSKIWWGVLGLVEEVVRAPWGSTSRDTVRDSSSSLFARVDARYFGIVDSGRIWR